MTRVERHPMTGRPRLLTMGLAALAASSWQSCSNDSTGDAAPAFLSLAARLEYARPATKRSVAIWERIVKDFPKSEWAEPSGRLLKEIKP